MSIIILGISRHELEVGQPTVKRLIWLYNGGKGSTFGSSRIRVKIENIMYFDGLVLQY